MEAKAGDRITDKARAKLAKALRVPVESTESVVAPKADGGRGQWFCVTCGAFPANNLEASGHPKAHRLAWRSFDSGKIEEP